MKLFDKFIDVFIWAFEIFILSLLFPFSLGGVILVLHPLAVWFTGQGILVYVLGIITGLMFKKWRDNKLFGW